MSTTNPDWLDHVREIQAEIERKGPAVVRSKMVPNASVDTYLELIRIQNQAPVPASTVKSHPYDWERFADEERRLTELKKLEVLAEARRAIDDLNNNKAPKPVPKPVEPAAPKKRYAIGSSHESKIIP